MALQKNKDIMTFSTTSPVDLTFINIITTISGSTTYKTSICYQCYLKQLLTSCAISVETSIQFTENYNFSILPQNANITPGL